MSECQTECNCVCANMRIHIYVLRVREKAGSIFFLKNFVILFYKDEVTITLLGQGNTTHYDTQKK